MNKTSKNNIESARIRNLPTRTNNTCITECTRSNAGRNVANLFLFVCGLAVAIVTLWIAIS